MTDFAEVRKLASLATDTIALCLAGELVGELHDLERQLADAKPAASVGEASPRRVIAERIAEIRQQMAEATVVFRLRAMGARAYSVFWASLPSRNEGESAEEWNARIFPFHADLVSRSCVDPAMTVDEVTELSDLLHGNAWIRLVGRCIAVNADEVNLPNFEAASELTGASEQT